MSIGAVPVKTELKLAVIGMTLALVLCASAPLKAAERPLSTDDVALLLIGGASPQKMIALIEQRGINFRLNPTLAKQFYQDGATDDVIDALQRASEKVKTPAASSVPSSSPSPSAPPPGGAGGGPMPASQPLEVPVRAPQPSSPPNHVIPIPASASKPAPLKASAPSPTAAPPPNNTPLPDPSPAKAQQIIQTFAAKEKLFKEARDNYTYHQINRVETLNASNQVDGVWEQDWDILFDGNGNRIERVTYAPESTLKSILVTEQDLESLRSIQPFVLTTDDLPEYDIRYLGHVHIDYITAYVFDIRPKEIRKGQEYFKGVVWVDDHDFQIVKAEGRMVPQLRNKNGQNLFPRFTTWRQQIDAKYWFPTFTLADDVLYFDSGPVHIREIIKYTDYKQFKSKYRILSATPVNQPATATPASPQK